MDAIYRQLGRVLWDIAGVETGAAAACGLLASSPHLTEAERRFLRGRMQPDERNHERLMARWGQAWYGRRPQRFLPYAATVWRDLAAAAQLPPRYRFAYAFATVHWNEVNTLRSQREIVPMLDAVDRAAAADFRQIAGEESEHVAWGHGIRARLEREDPVLSRIVERYLDLTGQVYPAVIGRSQARVWRQARSRTVAAGRPDTWPA